MRNVMVLGSGRSGTSAVTALFRNVPNVFFGYEMIGADSGNPTGYYECHVINRINDALLRRTTGVFLLDILPRRLSRMASSRFPMAHRDPRSLWLASPKRPQACPLDDSLAQIVATIGWHEPFCIKDPRFGFTLPFWRPHLPGDTRFLVVFRDPAETIASILKFAVDAYPEGPLPVTEDWVADHWKLLYMTILAHFEQGPPENWLFVNFEQVLSGRAIDAIASFCEADLDASHLMTDRVRSSNERVGTIAEEYRPLLHRLNSLANGNCRHPDIAQ